MKKILLILISISYLISNDYESEDGAPIRQGVHIEWYRTIAPGNLGESIFVWSDTRFGMRNIFAHKINQNGDFLWGQEGATVTNLPGRQEDPVAITDGNGGVYISWVDYRFDEEGDIYIQHLNSNGELQLSPDGVPLARVPGKQIGINMCTDSIGGVFVVWQDKRNNIDDDIYGTHVSSEYDIIAQGSGIAIVEEMGNQNSKSIEYAGNEEAFLAWTDYRQGANADIYGQRINTDLINLFPGNGLQIAGTVEQELKPRTTFVNQDISFLTWKQGDDNSKILYQLINTDGLVFSTPKSVSDNNAIQTAPRVKRTKDGSVFVNWRDLRHDPIDGDQYFQKINTNGEVEWGDGIRLDSSQSIDFNSRFTAGETGDLNVIWEQGEFPNVDIMFQNISSNGNHNSPVPTKISDASGYQFSPILSGTLEQGLFVVYGDQGSGSIDLKVQLISPQTNEGVWQNFGKIGMLGLDGDINYTNSFRIDDDDVLCIWEDNRSSKRIFGTRISDHINNYPEGKKITLSNNSSSETDFSTPMVIRSGDMTYVGTYDGSSSPKVIRINKFNDSLQNVWADSGLALTSTFDMSRGFLVPLSEGLGCFWSESGNSFNLDIRYQKIDANGNISAQPGGVTIIESNGDNYVISVLSTPDNHLIVFWGNDQWSPSGPVSEIKYKKITQDGETAIGWNPAGYRLTAPFTKSSDLQIRPISQSSGLIAVWIQQNQSTFADIRAQKINWDGNSIWDQYGVVISDENNDQVNVSLDVNVEGDRIFVAWEDFRNGTDFDIYGHLIDLDSGEPIGIETQFTNDTTNQYNPTVACIDENQFLVIWEDGRGYYNSDPLLVNGFDIYGSGYISNIGMTSNMNGFPICIAYHKQQDVNITKYNSNLYFLDWIDYRSSGKEDLANYYGKTLVKAQLLSSDNSSDPNYLPYHFKLHSVYPNPFNSNLVFVFDVPPKEQLVFKIYDINGRLMINRLIMPGLGGIRKMTWDGRLDNGSLLPSGIYLFSFNANGVIHKGKVTFLK